MTYSKQNKTKKKDVVERAIRGQNSSHIPFVSHHHHHWNLERYYVKLGKKKGNVLGGKFEKFFKGGICASYTGTQNSSSLPFFFCITHRQFSVLLQTDAHENTQKKTHFLKKLIPVLQEKKIIQNWQDKISFVCVCVCIRLCHAAPPLIFFFTIHLKFCLFIVSSLENTFLGRLVLLNINIILTHTHTRDGKNCTCNVIFFVCLFVLPVCLFFFNYYYFWQICAPAPLLSFHKKKLMMK